MARVLAIAVAIFLATAGPVFAALPESYGISLGWPLAPGQAAQVLQALSLSSSGATVGQSFSATVNGQTVGSILSLIDSVGGKYQLVGSTLSSTGSPALTVGTDNPQIKETLVGASNSPKTTTVAVVVSSSSSSNNQLFFPDGELMFAASVL